MLRVVSSIAFVVALSTAVFAQARIEGRWSGQQQARGSTESVVLDLKVSGEKLIGTMSTGNNAPMTLSDGKAVNGKVSFRTSIMFDGKERPIAWTGEVKGDDLYLTRTLVLSGVQGPPLVLKRAK